MPRGLRFHRFRTRLIVLIVGLLALVQVATYVSVSRANLDNALRAIDADLARGTRQYQEAVAVRIELLARSGSQMANDYAFRQLLLSEHMQTATLRSALLNSVERIGAPVIALFSLDGDLITNTREDLTAQHCAPFRLLIQQAVDHEERLTEGRFASDFAYLGGRLHVLVIVPLYAPYPEIVNWFGFAFPIDDALAQKLKTLANLEVTFVSGKEAGPRRVLASTLEAPLAANVAAYDFTEGTRERTHTVYLHDDPYVTAFQPLPLLGAEPALIALQRSLTEQLAPSRALEKVILTVTIAGLILAALAALGLARNVSDPVQQLARHTKRVRAGDYATRLDLPRADELGQLAQAFNEMTSGLAERDRVRDLLGKVVSPEIATQLLQSNLQLGGEEREVTILFCDLRDFTGLSEKMAPADILALLNRYLDRMSSIIEQHSGVIDKYIGDAIMALFGAPIADPAAPAKAIAAAREMARALEILNRELAAEGRPTLAFGIGINTARVVVGNMGSKTRLNYTVIGDGVNLASRLESLTKNPEYATPIIVSAATLQALPDPPPARELGEVRVKGKSTPVKIYALGAKGESLAPYHPTGDQ